MTTGATQQIDVDAGIERPHKSMDRLLRHAREDAGLTQKQLAQQTHLDPSYISNLERGIREPTITTFVSLCRAMHVKSYLLMYEIDAALDRGEIRIDRYRAQLRDEFTNLIALLNDASPGALTGVIERTPWLTEPPDCELSSHNQTQRLAERKEEWLADAPIRRVLYDALEDAFQIYRERCCAEKSAAPARDSSGTMRGNSV